MSLWGMPVDSCHCRVLFLLTTYRAALKASAEGAQFACSQSVVNEDDPMWQNSLDIKIPDFSISAHNKELFHNSSLNIAHGRVSSRKTCEWDIALPYALGSCKGLASY